MQERKEWLLKALLSSELDQEHEDYLVSRGALLSDLKREGVVTFLVPETPCPDPTWTAKYGDRMESFEGKIIFPLYSPQRDLLGFEWRDGDLKKKVFLSDNELRPVFLGMPFEMEGIWRTRKVWLVEGNLSRYTLKRQTPLPVLGAGTANVSDQQIRFLERFVDVVYCAFDQDSAGDFGFRAARKKIRRKDFKFERVVYGVKGDDPAKIWDRGGLASLNESFGGIEWL